jgi:predicted DNA-binding transcriptional regulator AlpA
MSASPKVISNDEAAALIGIKPSTLKFWRHKGRGPNFVKLGEAKQAGVAYVETDVIEWRDARKFASTSAYSPAAIANAKPNVRRSSDASA